MVRGIYKTIFAMLGAIAFSTTEADLGCVYAPSTPHAQVTEEGLVAELSLLATTFASFRTYHVRINNINLIEMAAKVGLKIDVGVHMTDEEGIKAEIKAVCVAYQSYRDTIRTVYVGNENLQNNNFGTFTSVEIIKYIKQVQACVGGNVRVGTVQRINEWLSAPGAEEIVKVSGQVGVNIYSFFSGTTTLTNIEMLDAQWNQLAERYGDMTKWSVAETGWPTAGESMNGHVPSHATAQQYLNDVVTWSEGKIVMWFMFSDSLVSYNGLEVEKHFGLYDATCTTAKLELPVLSLVTNLGNSTTPSSPASSMPEQQEMPMPKVDEPIMRSPEPLKIQPLEMDAVVSVVGKPLEQGAEDKVQSLHSSPPGGAYVEKTGKDCPS